MKPIGLSISYLVSYRLSSSDQSGSGSPPCCSSHYCSATRTGSRTSTVVSLSRMRWAKAATLTARLHLQLVFAFSRKASHQSAMLLLESSISPVPIPTVPPVLSICFAGQRPFWRQRFLPACIQRAFVWVMHHAQVYIGVELEEGACDG